MAEGLPAGVDQSLTESSSSQSEVGRPRVDAQVDDILQLRKLHFKWTKISSILNISRSTLYRRLEEGGVSLNDYTEISDQDLDNVIQSIKRDHPNDGEVLMQGHLLSKDIRVPRESLRRSIHRVDSAGVTARRISTIRRRVYSVPHPNFIWHIDGNHKLIRWHFVVHGAVDGYSRLITYLKCADNNRASTVLECFENGVSNFGLPDKIRSDHGGENTEAWRYMIASHDGRYSSVITGSSVHNERVERMWKDVNRSVGSIYKSVFRSLENDGILNPLNDVDLYCLHYIFLPRLNKCLSEFQDCWNSHGLSTESNMTPNQLYFEGLSCETQGGDRDLNAWLDINMVDLPQGEHVQIPRHSFFPCTSLRQTLSTVQTLDIICSDHGRSFYVRAIHLIGEHLESNCTQCTS